MCIRDSLKTVKSPLYQWRMLPEWIFTGICQPMRYTTILPSRTWIIMRTKLTSVSLCGKRHSFKTANITIISVILTTEASFSIYGRPVWAPGTRACSVSRPEDVRSDQNQGPSKKALAFYGALRSRCGHYILQLWFYLLACFLFPGLFSAVADWMSTILPHMMWP